MATNPYAAPQARVADAAPGKGPDGDFIPDGQAVAAGRGWAWIVEAWQLFRASPWVWIGIGVAIIVGYVAVSVLPFGQIAFLLLAPPVVAGLMLGCRAQEEGGELAFGALLEGFRLPQTGRLVTVGAIALGATVALVALVFGLVAATVGLAAFDRSGGGFMMIGLVVALLVLGISIPLYMALWFAPALVVFQDYGAVDALKASFRACLRNVLPFLVYSLALAFWSVVALIPLGLGILVLMPVFVASVYTAYRDIFHTR